MRSSAASPPHRRFSHSKKLLFAVILMGLLLVTLEVLSFAAYYLTEGDPPLPERVAARRAAIAGKALEGGGGDGAVDAEALSRRLPWYLATEVLHPYLGYVADPMVNRRKKVPFPGFRISELGFYRPEPPPPPDRTAFTVAFFGGSVAFITSIAGHRALERRLEASPGLAGRRVRVESFALAGYKQPQQLQTLSFLLALGRHFDVVVNLDGFNEVALGVADDAARGVFPHFPRTWDLRLVGTVEPERLRRMGEVALLQERRRALAQAFSGGPLTWSAGWNFLWNWLDRRQAAALAAAEATLAESPSPETTYAAHGPARKYSSDEAILQEIAQVWARSSLLMDRLCHANGMEYHHFLQPNQYVPGSKRLSAEERRKAFREDHRLRPYVVAGYPLLLREGEQLRRQGVSFHDLTRLFAAVEETRYVDSCCHLNQKGTDRMVEVIAGAILEDLETKHP